MAERGIPTITVDGVEYSVNDPNNAPEFAPGTGNTAGDLVTYQGKLYRIREDRESGEFPSTADQTTVNREIKRINTDDEAAKRQLAISVMTRRYANGSTGLYGIVSGGINDDGSVTVSRTNNALMPLVGTGPQGNAIRLRDDTYTIYRVWMYKNGTPVRCLIGAGDERRGTQTLIIPPKSDTENEFRVSFALTADYSHVMTAEDIAALKDAVEVYRADDIMGTINDRTEYQIANNNITYSVGGLNTEGKANNDHAYLRFRMTDPPMGAFTVSAGSVITPNDGYAMTVALYTYYNGNDDNQLKTMYTDRTTPLTLNSNSIVRIAYRRTDSAELWYRNESNVIQLTEAGTAAKNGAVTLGLISGTVKDAIAALQEKESNVPFESVVELTDNIPNNAAGYHALWDDMVSAGYVSRTLLGKVNNDNTLPVYMYTIQNDMDHIKPNYGIDPWDGSNEIYDRPIIFITSGIHGNERTTPFALYSFVKALFTDVAYQRMRNSFYWYIIPLVNPWGFGHSAKNNSTGNWDHGNSYTDETLSNYTVYDNTDSANYGIRRNMAGIDINRDFGTFATAEAQLVRDALNSVTNNGEKDILYAIDFHQASYGDSLQYIGAFMSLSDDASAEDKTRIYTRWMSAGGKTELLMADYCDVPYLQSVYTWQGAGTPGTMRNYAIQYADFSMTFEGGQTIGYYSDSTAWSNPIARTFVNTQVHLFMEELTK